MATRLDYIFINANHIYHCQNVVTQFGNSDHLLVECELQLTPTSSKAKQWRFSQSSWNNSLLKSEIIEEVTNIHDFTKWDLYKCRIQSIIRAFRPQASPEKKIQKLQKRLTELDNKASNSENTDEILIIRENIKSQLQEEL